MLEVEAVQAGVVRVEIASHANFEMLVLNAEIGAARRGVVNAAALYDQEGINLNAQFVGPVADQAQGVVAGVDEGLGVLPSAAKDVVIPDLDIVPHQLAGPSVVQHGAALAQAKGDGFDRGAGQFIDQGDVFLGGHGRLVAVDVGMPAVVVVHDFGLVHSEILFVAKNGLI